MMSAAPSTSASSQTMTGERPPRSIVAGFMSEPALAAYRTAAFQAIQRCRERDGALHWRPEVVYALAVR